jgi:hypothetical protein
MVEEGIGSYLLVLSGTRRKSRTGVCGVMPDRHQMKSATPHILLAHKDWRACVFV